MRNSDKLQRSNFVLIGLVIVFKKQINDLVTKIFKKITTDSNKIIGWDGSLYPFV